MTRLVQLLPSLERAAGTAVRLWETDGTGWRQLAGRPTEWAPGPADGKGHAVTTPDGDAWFEPVPAAPGVWLETARPRAGVDPGALAEVVGAVLDTGRELQQVAAELSGTYEEINLLYTISEILGGTIRLNDAASNILREVSLVVGARRASLFVEERGELRTVAARGIPLDELDPIEIDDACSVTAMVFRSGRAVCYDPGEPGAPDPGCKDPSRRYRGRAFLSVPVMYAAPGGTARSIGVLNLTDREGADAFTAGDRKLVTAVANQIGAAIENVRLREQEMGQQRLRRELELAHHLQLKLLPAPSALGGHVDVGVRCVPAEQVGGDFYHLLRLSGDRSGVMIGDVSTHGFSAALIMTLAMSAAGIHAETSDSPSEVLRRLEESLADELDRTDMFLTLSYVVLDPVHGRLTYASAGHGHAWCVHGPSGRHERLAATRPPLGLSESRGEDVARPWRHGEDLLVLLTDGVIDAVDDRGERFGESRALGHVHRLHDRRAGEIVDALFTGLAAFSGGRAGDDRTAVIVRA